MMFLGESSTMKFLLKKPTMPRIYLKAYHPPINKTLPSKQARKAREKD
jgi:hypothetical protein